MMESCLKLSALLCTVLLVAPVHVDSYSIHGTKRFQRNNNVQQMPKAAAFVGQAPVQIFTPIQTTGVANSQFDPMDGYYADDPNNYLYYAPHDPQYHSYGMKVYQGDYKPAPYYYAQGPTYQYYDDKEASNPLDDLHEEMMEEDEREREEQQLRLQQQLLQQRQYGQHRHQQQQAFNDDYPDLVKPRNYYQPIYEAGAQQGQDDFDYGGGVEDASLNVDPSYAQANAAFLNNLIQYNRQMTKSRHNKNSNSHLDALKAHNLNVQPARSEYNSNWNVDYPLLAAEAADEDYQASYPMLNEYRAPFHASSEDKAVRELKELTHSRDKASPSLRKSAQPMIPAAQYDEDEGYMGDTAANLDKDNKFANQYDYDEGGDEWINWDSKRSGGGIVKPASVGAFTDRKPSKIVITKVPENHFVLEHSSLENTATTETAALKEEEQSEGAQVATATTTTVSGQKEQVLMRPAPPVRHPFSAPVLKMMENQENMKANRHDHEDLTNNKRSAESNDMRTPPKVTVYDTIKQLLEMDQNLKSSGASATVPRFVSRLQKRFVTDEGSLVKQLESLKKSKV